MKKLLVCLAMVGVLMGSNSFAADMAQIHKNLVDNSGKVIETMQNNQSPASVDPLLSQEDLLVMVDAVKKQYAAGGKDITDLQAAALVGAIGAFEASGDMIKKAFQDAFKKGE